MSDEQPNYDARRFRFGLRGLFWVTSGACVLLAVAAWMPRLAVTWYPMLGVAAIFAGLAILDMRVLRRESTAVRAWGSWGMIAVSVGLLIVMAVCYHLPGGGGPIQYVRGNRLAEVVFNLRLRMLLLYVVSPVVCGLVGIFRRVDGFNSHPSWMISAIGLYALVWVVISLNPWFLPTV